MFVDNGEDGISTLDGLFNVSEIVNDWDNAGGFGDIVALEL